MATKNLKIVGTMPVEFIHELVVNNVPNYKGVKAVFTRGVISLIRQHNMSPISHMRSMNYGEVKPSVDNAPDTKIYVCLQNCDDNYKLMRLLQGKEMQSPGGEWFTLDPQPLRICKVDISLTDPWSNEESIEEQIIDDNDDWTPIKKNESVMQPATPNYVPLLTPAPTPPVTPQRSSRPRVIDRLFPQPRPTSLPPNAGGM